MKKRSANEYLLSIPLWRKQKNSLEDIRKFLVELDCQESEFNIIHVAGTNGKGSVCAFLTSILKEAGFPVGTFTSPHLVDIRERIMIDGEMVDSKMFQSAFEQVYAITDRMMKASYCHPTFFEFLFLMAMVIFKENHVAYVVMETGLGGTLDTTNALEHPAISVITSISMDHMEYLGDTIEKIASQKAGIIKPGIPVVYDSNCYEASWIIQERAQALGSTAYPVSKGDIDSEYTKKGCFSLTIKKEPDHRYQILSAAGYQAMNAALAISTIKTLVAPVSQHNIEEGTRKTIWPGRMEEILPGVYLDGAHNAGGIQAFIETATILGQITGKKMYLLFAAVSDKEYDKMIENLCKELTWSGIATAHINNSRGLAEDMLEQVFLTYASCPVTGYTQVEDAVTHMLDMRHGEELIFCVGSLYLIGEIKSVLRRICYD